MASSKILLIRPNYKSSTITPPLGLGYLSSYLKKNGFSAVIVDALRDNLSDTQILHRVLEEKPDAVGINCVSAFYNDVVNLSRLLKKNNIRCVIGGVHPTFMPYQTLTDTGANFIILGEGELALTELLKNNFTNDNIQGVYSLDSLKSPNQPVEKARIVESLDDIPFPDWEQISPQKYKIAPHGTIIKNLPIGTIVTTRGCPYDCIFCASPKFHNRRIRFRSPENVISEIKHLVTDYGVKEIHFVDDNLTIKREHIERICNLILESNLRVSWACPNGIRADRIDEGLLKLMSKSGCYWISFGIESANSQILKNIRKRETIKQIEKAIQAAQRQSIACQGFFIFGLPGETNETIKESIDFAKRSKLSRALFFILDILPGSELWDTLKGEFKPNFTKKSYKEADWLPEGLTEKQLMRAQARAFKAFYLRPKILWGLLKSIRFHQIKSLWIKLKEFNVIRDTVG